jgi:uncharacterized iron-regulated membrane protein
MRNLGVLTHRWLGLFTAVFLFISGLTGAVISWDHELDEWLNPQLFKFQSAGERLPALELANRIERAHPTMMVTFMPLNTEAGHTFKASMKPRLDPATGKAYAADYDQAAFNPEDGSLLGKRMWGEIALTRENLLPFLYKLHYTMHIPDGWGVELGMLFMGIVGIVWVFDSLVALWLSFPRWSVWKKSLVFRWKRGGYPLKFDLHRSGGVWVWLFLLLLAVTSVSMNLNYQVMRPVVSMFSELTPDPFSMIAPKPVDEPIEPVARREEVLAIARAEAQQRGITDPAGGIFYSPEFGVYGVGFYQPENDHGDGGLGNPWLYFDGKDGKPMGAKIPGTGSAGDIFMQAQFPLHSGRILGLPGRIMISIMGLVVAMLSLTGIIIWLHKRRNRALQRYQQVSMEQGMAGGIS